MRRTLRESKTIADENPFSLSLGDLIGRATVNFRSLAIVSDAGLNGKKEKSTGEG